MTTGVYTDNLLCAPWFDAAFMNSCCKATRTADPPIDVDIIDMYIMLASEIMYYWLGRQFRGECQITFRPKVSCGCGWWWWNGYRPVATWGDSSSGGGTANNCTCGGHVPQVDLGVYPVTSIDAVRINGVDLNPDLFHIDEYRFLVADNGNTFPTMQNLFSVPGAAGDAAPEWVFEVTVNYGQPVPMLAKRAAARLACELIKDGCLDIPCQLPARVISYVRQGISAQVQSSQDILNQGLIGILEIDLALRAYNPSHLQSPSFIWSPDLVQGGRRTYT